MWEAIAIHPVSQIRADAPRYRRWMLREIWARRFYAFIAETADGRVAGSGAVWLQPVQPRPDPAPRPATPYIMSMFTGPGFRGMGVASELVETMVRWARGRGYSRVSLHASKAGRPVYERLGFEATNEMRRNLR
jgi:GNAT superfamily N-acetyltransferase